MGGIMDRLNAAGRAAAQGTTFGWGDELGAEILKRLPQPDDGTGIPREYAGGQYEQYRDMSRADDNAAAKAHPGVYYPTMIASGLPLAYATGTGTAANTIMGALGGLGSSEATDANGMLGDTAVGAGMGAFLPGALKEVAGQVAPMVAPLSQRLRAAGVGLSKEVAPALEKLGIRTGKDAAKAGATASQAQDALAGKADPVLMEDVHRRLGPQAAEELAPNTQPQPAWEMDVGPKSYMMTDDVSQVPSQRLDYVGGVSDSPGIGEGFQGRYLVEMPRPEDALKVDYSSGDQALAQNMRVINRLTQKTPQPSEIYDNALAYSSHPSARLDQRPQGTPGKYYAALTPDQQYTLGQMPPGRKADLLRRLGYEPRNPEAIERLPAAQDAWSVPILGDLEKGPMGALNRMSIPRDITHTQVNSVEDLAKPWLARQEQGMVDERPFSGGGTLQRSPSAAEREQVLESLRKGARNRIKKFAMEDERIVEGPLDVPSDQTRIIGREDLGVQPEHVPGVTEGKLGPEESYSDLMTNWGQPIRGADNKFFSDPTAKPTSTPVLPADRLSQYGRTKNNPAATKLVRDQLEPEHLPQWDQLSKDAELASQAQAAKPNVPAQAAGQILDRLSSFDPERIPGSVMSLPDDY